MNTNFLVATRWGCAAVLLVVLVCLSYFDLKTRRLPNVLVAVVAVLGLIPVLVATSVSDSAEPLMQAGQGLLAAAAPGLAIEIIWRLIRRNSGLGGGDLKLLAALGLTLGPVALLLLPLASLLSLPQAAFTHFQKEARGRHIAFGPYIAAAAVILYVLSLRA